MVQTTSTRPSWVDPTQQWYEGETQDQYEKAGKKLASGVASVLPATANTPPSTYRYGDPYQMYNDYMKKGGKKSMTDWENSGRPGNDVLDPNAEKNYYGSLDTTAPTEVEQRAIKDKTAKDMQDRIDAIDSYYATLISQEQERGNQRLKSGLGKNLAASSRRGILDTPMGEAMRINEERGQQKYTADNVKLLQEEQNLKKMAVLDKIDSRAEEAIRLAKEEAKGNYDLVEKKKTEWRNSVRNEEIPTLAKTTSLALLKANKSIYDQLYNQGQFGSELEFDTFYNNSRDKSLKIDYTYAWKGDNLVATGVDPLTNKLDVKTYKASELGIPKDTDLQTITNDLTGEVYWYDKNNPESGIKKMGNVGIKKIINPTTKDNIATVNNFIETKKGQDGKISWETYQEAFKKYQNLGGTLSDFKNRFIPEQLMDAGNIKDMPTYLKAKEPSTTQWEEQKIIWKQLNSPEMRDQPDDVKADYVKNEGFDPADFDL